MSSKSCCNIEAVVSFDNRGQLVLPKDLREKYNLKPGDKFAVISCTDDVGDLCCFSLVKAKDLQGKVQDFLGPFFKNLATP